MAAEPPSSPIIPYLHSFDDHDISLFDDILMLDEIPSLNLADSPLLTQPDNPVPVNPVGTGTLHSTATASTSQEVPNSEFRGETSHQRGVLQPDISGFGNPVPLPVWPAPPVPFTCSCCQVLREIIHTKGIANCVTFGPLQLLYYLFIHTSNIYKQIKPSLQSQSNAHVMFMYGFDSLAYSFRTCILTELKIDTCQEWELGELIQSLWMEDNLVTYIAPTQWVIKISPTSTSAPIDPFVYFDLRGWDSLDPPS